MQTATAYIAANLGFNIIPTCCHKRRLFFFRFVEAALKGPAARCPHSPSPVTAPVLWETNSADHLCLFFPGFSFFSPALSTCVRGSIVYIPDMLRVSMGHIPHVCRFFHQHLPAFPSYSFAIIAPLIFFFFFFSVQKHMSVKSFG